MNIREELEERELRDLSEFAAKSRYSLGRDMYEPPCEIRTVYQRDRDRILHAKAFRRLKHKTQVFLSPSGDHYRTRLTHTLEVAQIARTISRALRLNEDLTEAIALGHDLGHTPFGHAGEDTLDAVCPEGFSHVEQSVRVVEVLEKEGEGLNLTKEVRDGILNHRMRGNPATLEGQAVRLADKIAYINHDIDDAIRAGLLTEEMLPREATAVLGHSVRLRLDTLVKSVIMNSRGKDALSMSPEVFDAMSDLRNFMFRHIYTNSIAKAEDVKAKRMLEMLYEYFHENIEQLPQEYIHLIWIRHDTEERVVCDYVSGMTDTYAIDTFRRLFVPRGW